MRVFANVVLALSVTISLIASSLGHAHQARRHHVHRQDDLARRDPGEIHLYKRFDGARLTFYDVGLGACGGTNQPGDFVVALNAAQFNGGQYCNQMITIEANGKSTQAQIVDLCPGCPYLGLDLSVGLFSFFADLSVGVLTATWSFGSGGPAPSPSPSPAPPPPTSSVDIPLTSWVPPPTTTSQPPPTTTTSTSFSSHSSTTASNSSSVPNQTTSSIVAATTGALPGGAANSSVLFNMDLSMVYIGRFLGACSSL